jgi:hypothetical protein
MLGRMTSEPPFGPPGDPERHLALSELERRFERLAPAPRDAGRVRFVVKRAPDKTRNVLDRVELRPGTGILGDAWGRNPAPDPTAELTVMELAVAELIANGQPVTVFGDNLFMDLDLSNQNLPTGSRLRVGEALLEVTPKPHNGCRKFAARFGRDALLFVSKRELRHRNLRGIYMRVLEGGPIAPGVSVEVLSRAPLDA